MCFATQIWSLMSLQKNFMIIAQSTAIEAALRHHVTFHVAPHVKFA